MKGFPLLAALALCLCLAAPAAADNTLPSSFFTGTFFAGGEGVPGGLRPLREAF
jgi:hypothetical protein